MNHPYGVLSANNQTTVECDACNEWTAREHATHHLCTKCRQAVLSRLNQLVHQNFTTNERAVIHDADELNPLF